MLWHLFTGLFVAVWLRTDVWLAAAAAAAGRGGRYTGGRRVGLHDLQHGAQKARASRQICALAGNIKVKVLRVKLTLTVLAHAQMQANNACQHQLCLPFQAETHLPIRSDICGPYLYVVRVGL